MSLNSGALHFELAEVPVSVKLYTALSLLIRSTARPRTPIGITVVFLLLLSFCSGAFAQATAPQTKQAMKAYEGQRVASLIFAGRPDLNTNDLMNVVSQKVDQPFSNAKIDQSIAALKKVGHFTDVTVEIRPLANGVNVRLVLQPALYLGIYTFSGSGFFSYSGLLQAAAYPVKTAYSTEDIATAQKGLEALFRRTGFFTAVVTPEIQPDFQEGLVNVVFHIKLGKRAKFGKINFQGASPEIARKLTKDMHSVFARLHAAHLDTDDTYSYKRLTNVAQYLQNKLIADHYLTAQVNLVAANYNPQTNHADVDFKVTTGPIVRTKVIGGGVSGKNKRQLIPIVAEDSVQRGVIEEGQQNLVSYFQSKGYFSAKVTNSVVRQPGNVLITYDVRKGPRNKVDDISMKGNRHMGDDELLAHVAVEKGGMITKGKYSQELVRKSIDNLQTIYKNAGYNNTKIIPQIKRESDGDIHLTFVIDEGPLDTAATFQMVGNSVPVSKLAPEGLEVGTGKAYSQYLVQQDKNRILATYLNLGYLNASFSSVAKPSASDPHELNVVYKIIEGPRVQIARVITVGRHHTRQSLIKTVAKIEPEQPLSETEMLAAEGRLYTLNIFDWAEIDPRAPVTTQSEDDVVIKLHEQKRNEITYGFGFEVINRGGSVPSGTVAVPGIPPVGLPSNFKTSQKTFWGPRGSFEYTRLNMRGRAETLTLGGLASRLDQRGSLAYHIPTFRNSSWNVTGNIGGENNSENPIYTARIGEGGLQFQRFMDAKKTKSVILRYNLRYTSLSHLLIPDLVPVSDRNLRISTLSGTFVRDTRDNPLDAHKGIYESAEFDLNAVPMASSVNFVRFLGQVAYYKNIGIENIIWANSIRIGLMNPYAGSRVPLSEKFFSGGGSTLRGFPLNGAGPQRTIAACGNPSDPTTCARIRVPVGGDALFILNSELRIPVPLKKGLGVVGFYDGGNVYSHIRFSDFASNYTNTIGFGVRYETPVGPVRLDIGHNLNAVPGIKATQIFITLGQAF
ncbi:MAG: POTRA domain-containing protein [Terriglobia bacterium]|nr:POTRA domain-containing protein [Terriglobia bacterium]